ncbi:Copper amine oxidase N-terminal domain-containing protein [Paenibacillus sp. UNCCL117]|nr:Copper amine oxidase N-terminal domain-containing protein [Paenibacillus sp. cl123]SFW57174.1 Copper amine oxidase N-terminal domain-containing protein [Paenibacillus sp. UNCCL117]
MKKNARKLFLIPLMVTLILSLTGLGGSDKVQAADVLSTDQIFEAEAGTVAAPMQVYSDKPDASGSYIMVPATKPRVDGPIKAIVAPEAKYSITVNTARAYQVWARVFTSNGSAANAFLTFDSAGTYTQYSIPAGAGWKWVKLGSVSLTQGVHEMRIKYRDPGVGFDRFVVTSNAAYTPTGLGTDPAVMPENIYPNPYIQPTITPPSEHPRLFVRSSDIPRIKENLTKGELVQVWDRVLLTSAQNVTGMLSPPPPGDVTTNYNATITSVVRANALLYLLNGDTAAGHKAVDVMYNFFNTVVFPSHTAGGSPRDMGEVIVTAAIVYDWCYDLMNDAQRLNFRQNMERVAINMEMGYPSTKLGAVVGHGAESELMRNILSFGVAAYNESPDIYEIAAGRFFQQYIDSRNYMYAAEWNSQGESYGMSRFQWDMFATFLFDRMGEGNVFSPQQAKMPYQDIYTQRPDGQRLRYGDGFSTYFKLGQYWTNDTMAMMLTSSYYKDHILRGEFLKRYNYGTSNSLIDDIWMVLFDDPGLPSASEKSLPLSKYFGDPMGIMVARTGWEGGLNSSTAVAQMNIGEMYFANHQHLDAGSFQFYYKGGLAIDSGVYQGIKDGYGSDSDINYNKRTIASNSMLVYDSSEKFHYWGKEIVNDGGQRTPNGLAEPNTLDALLDPANGYKTAEVLHQSFGPDANTPDYTFIKGDLTKAYSSKVGDYKRSMVFLNLKDHTHPAALLVYDKLTSTNREFKKTWLLHSEKEPKIDGNTVNIARDDSGYNGKLVNTSLLPTSDNASILPIGGPGKEFFVAGKNYPNPTNDSANNPEFGAWRVEISPKTLTETDEFLNVMQVMDNVNGPAPLAVEQVNGDKFVGAKISNRVVLFGKESQPISDTATFTVSGSERNLYYLVTDLTPGYWTVTKAGETAATQIEVTQEKGELYFQGSPGAYTLTHYNVRTLPEPLPVPNIPAPPAQNTIVIKLDGTQLPNDERAQIVDGAIMLPAEHVLGALGARVQEQATSGTLVAKKLARTVEITVGSKQIKVNGVTTEMDKEALLIGGKLFIPLAALPATTWGKATWDAEFQVVTITSITPQANYGLIGITVSDGVYSGENTIDGDTATRWSSDGDNAWIRYDLGSVKPINRIGIAWYKGDERNAVYDIQISENGSDWTTVYSGQSSGASSAIEETVFSTVIGRYVRIVGHGYISKYGLIQNNSISEVTLYSGLLPVASVSAISETPGNEGNKALDGDLATYWTAEGDNKWIKFDLGSVQSVSGVGTAWNKGSERQQIFDLLVSVDGSAWTTVFSGRNNGNTGKMENIYFQDIKARYVQVIGHGNTVSRWNSLAEISIYGTSVGSGTSALSAGNISFTDSNGAPISSLAPNSEAFAKVSVTNNGNAAAEVTLAAPLFRDDTQLDLQVVKAALQPGETKLLSVAVSVPSDASDCFLNVFVWDELQRPVIPSVAFPQQDVALKSILIGGVPLAGFDPNILAYTIDPTTVSATGVPQVAAEANSPSATVAIVQPTDLEGKAIITVTDRTGVTEKVYQIQYHVISHDATLQELKVNGTDLAGFSGDITDYTFTQGSNRIPVLTATPSHPKATMLISQPTLVPGVATITVTAEDGITTKQYTVNVLFQLGTNATLKDLKINGTTVPGFSSGITSYTAGLTGKDLVSYPVTTITASSTDPNATVQITQPTGVPGAATVRVTAEDGVTVLNYTVNLQYIKGTDATLSDLKVGNTTIPGFTSNTFNYTHNYVPSGHPELTSLPKISGVAADALASVVVTQAQSLPGYAVVVVTAEDGVTVKQYKVKINSVNVGGTSVITTFNNAYVSSTAPNTNYHSTPANPYLLAAANKYETYLKFDISEVKGNVSAATLNFRAQTWSAGTVTISVYGAENDSWNETGVTWNNKPAAEALLGSVSVDKAWKESSIDITGMIQSILSANQSNPAAADPYVTIVVRNDSASNVAQFVSRHREYYPPYLRIKTN